MKNDIILTRNIRLQCWRIQATIAIAKPRIDLLPLLMHIQENDTITSVNVARKLLFDSRARKVVAERLLNIAQKLSLVVGEKSGYALTPDGRKALETKKIFIPEEGSWTIWASEDSLLPFPVLACKPYNEPSAADEIIGNRRKKEQPQRQFRLLPQWVHHIKDTYATPGVGGNELRIDDLKNQAEQITSGQDNLKLVWNVSQARLQLQGSIAGENINSELPAPNVTSDDIWHQLLDNNGQLLDWDDDKQTLAIAFADTKNTEKQSMLTNLGFTKPEIAQYGHFDDFAAQGIQLRAKSHQDAEDWALWRLQANIRDYATEQRFAQWNKKAQLPFVDFDIDLPTRSELAQQHWLTHQNKPSPQTWHLVAAQDWQL